MTYTTKSSFLKDTIADALVLLLEKKQLDEISVSEIVLKAGVNRSTYYRHYRNKQEVVRHFYSCLLDTCLRSIDASFTIREYFIHIFRNFLQYKEHLRLLDQRSLTYLLLDEMNQRISFYHRDSEDDLLWFYSQYHIGGVFNAFCFWLREDMTTSPEELAERCICILPDEFSPELTRK